MLAGTSALSRNARECGTDRPPEAPGRARGDLRPQYRLSRDSILLRRGGGAIHDFLEEAGDSETRDASSGARAMISYLGMSSPLVMFSATYLRKGSAPPRLTSPLIH